MRNIWYLLGFLCVIKISRAYIINVDAQTEECFLEKVLAGANLNFKFEVISGGFLDIDVHVRAPNGAVILEKQKEGHGSFSFMAAMDGVYTYCFDNRMSTLTPKNVMFEMDLKSEEEAAEAVAIGDSADLTDKNNRTHTKLAQLLETLSGELLSVKHELEYMEAREVGHRAITEATNSRVAMWSVFEALLMIAMAVGQAYYLKRFFEVRRVV